MNMPICSGRRAALIVCLLLSGRPAQGQVVTSPRWSRIAAGDNHTCGLTTQGTAYCWGENKAGQLGMLSTALSSTWPVPVATSETFTDIAAGIGFTCALAASKAVYCWGNTLSDSPGATPRVIDGTGRIERLFAAGRHACGLDADGVASCWGNPVWHVLGTKDEARERWRVARPVDTDQRFVTLALSEKTSCGLNRQGAAYCWGTPPEAMLQKKTDSVKKVPVQMKHTIPFVAIATAEEQTCATDRDGFLYCWGWSGHNRTEPAMLGIVAWGERLTPTLVENEVEFQSLVRSPRNLCGLATGGRAYCMGSNFYGQLGVPSSAAQAIMKFRAVAPSRTFTQLILGESSHICGLTTDGGAYCWGRGAEGQLGNGSTEDRVLPVQVLIP